jgi:hypothetical protein
MKALPETANIWILTAAREIILGGFEQDLYAPYERPLAYWLIAHVTDQHIRSLETLISLSLAGRGGFPATYDTLGTLKKTLSRNCHAEGMALSNCISKLYSDDERRALFGN